ncbi:hypothetical protein ALC56_15304, partial [Trachymyrmex septentrionalis]
YRSTPHCTTEKTPAKLHLNRRFSTKLDVIKSDIRSKVEQKQSDQQRDYVWYLNDVLLQSRHQSCIRSTLHEVYTVSELKLALSPYDDKRYVIPESVATLGDIIKYLCNVRCIFLLE